MSDHVDFKVVLLGKEYSGKTSLVERYLNDRFVGENRYQNTIGAAYGAKKLIVDGGRLTMGIWDTAGSERYEAMSRLYYRNARAAILCYDPSDPESFDRLKYWTKELKKSEKDAKIYFCATKMDKNGSNKPIVDKHEVLDLAEDLEAVVFETSAKTGDKVKDLFHSIVRDYARDPKTSLTSFEDVRQVTMPPRSSSSCCSK